MNLKPQTQWALFGSAVLLILTLFLTQSDVSLGGNEASRFGTIQAVGDQNVFHIENTLFHYTLDRRAYHGHVYSDKPLPLGVTAAVVYKAFFRPLGIQFQNHYHVCIYLLNLLFGGIVNLALFLLFFRFLCRFKGELFLKFLLAFSLAAGSWLFSYSVTLNNHVPAALALLILLMLLRQIRPESSGWKLPFAAGLAAGCVGWLDLPGGVIFGFAAILSAGFSARRLSAPLFVLLGGGIMAAVMLGLNWTAYGSVIPLYVANGGGTFRWVSHADFGVYLFHTLIGGRGVFSYQPFALLGVIAILVKFRKFRLAERILFAASFLFAAFYIGITVEYGGGAYGFRYLIAVLPLWYYAGSRWVLSWKGRKNLQYTLVLLLMLPGMIAALVGSYAPFCVADEGVNTPPGHFCREISSTFAGNLLAWSFETAPDSAFTRIQLERYAPKNAMKFLYYSYFYQKRPDLIARLLQSPLAARAAGEGKK